MAAPAKAFSSVPDLPPLPHPVKLRPRFVPKPWGGRIMETALGMELPGTDGIGEAWLAFDRDGDSSEVLEGPLDGSHLANLRGDAPYPLLLKLLDARARLSVQVHPTEASAARHGGEPKTECWFVLDAAPGARVYRGLADGCDRGTLLEALASGDVERCLHAVPVAAGDTVFVPAGTVHSIGAGVLLAEVQQNSDTTLRLHDWGRTGADGAPRELHVEAALDSIEFGPRSEDKVPAQEIEDEGSVRRILLVRSPHFSAENVSAMGTFTLDVPPTTDGTWRLVHVLRGKGELRSFERGTAPVRFAPGDTLLLPARHDAFEVALGATILRALVVYR